jgi:hypothetical protein
LALTKKEVTMQTQPVSRHAAALNPLSDEVKYGRRQTAVPQVVYRLVTPLLAAAKNISLSFFLCAVMAVAAASAFAQDLNGPLVGHYDAFPLQGNTAEKALQESLSGTTLPMWSTTVKYSQWYGFGWNYKVQALGADPSSNTTTNLPTILIALTLNFRDVNGGLVASFNPTVPGPACAGGVTPLTAVQKSPLFNNSGPFMWGTPTQVNFGTTQYIDALQRAAWYPSDAGYGNWHTLFQLTSAIAVTIDVPAGQWKLVTAPCGQLGLVAETGLASTAQSLISALSGYGVNPTTLPVILLSNVASFTGNTVCCTLGFHSAFGSPVQVYALAMYDGTGAFQNSADITPLSHELAEAVDNPTLTNATPSWGHTGQVSACQSSLEVGDPLSGKLYPTIALNGYSYHPQEMAMVPWFFGSNTGLGWYSTNGTFKRPAGLCFDFNIWLPYPATPFPAPWLD